MNRRRKFGLNTISTLIYEVITLVCGFVLPKFVIPYFGSATNGLINSITQFLTVITLCECGIGAVVQSALYKPLADKDDEEISRVIIASDRFFNKIMLLLSIYVAGLMVIYPFMIKENFDWFYTAGLILIMAVNFIAQYYLFLSCRLLLTADQLSYIQLIAHSVVLVLNTVVTIVLIQLGASVHIVKLASAAIFFIQPFAIKFYVDKHYHINRKLKFDGEPLPQKWNGIAQHIASVAQQNVPTIVLTLFATLSDVSIYGVYFLIAHGIRQIVYSFRTPILPMLGNMYAKGERETLDKTFSTVEFAFHTIVTLLFTITGVLILPFVRIYTLNFTDADYIQPVFAIFMVLAQAAFCLRVPYEMLIKMAGHYKQTQTSSIIEAVICAVVSVAFVLWFGLVGVAIGTLASMLYRTVYLAFYLSKNIMHRNIWHFIKYIGVDTLSAALMVLATCWIRLGELNYFSWVLMALQVGFISLGVCIVVNFIFCRGELFAIKSLLKRKKKS